MTGERETYEMGFEPDPMVGHGGIEPISMVLYRTGMHEPVLVLYRFLGTAPGFEPGT